MAWQVQYESSYSNILWPHPPFTLSPSLITLHSPLSTLRSPLSALKGFLFICLCTVVEDVHEMTDELMGAFSPPDTIDKTEGSM